MSPGFAKDHYRSDEQIKYCINLWIALESEQGKIEDNTENFKNTSS